MPLRKLRAWRAARNRPKPELAIEQRFVHQMIDHARAGYPNEACGLVAGLNGRVIKVYPMRNAENSPVRYVIDPREQLDVMREMEEQGWQLFGIFHSHTHSPAYPSQTDVQLAYFSEAYYFIVSLMREDPSVQAFRIVNGKIEQEELIIKD